MARAARARAQGAPVRTESTVVRGRRHAQARVRRAQSAPSVPVLVDGDFTLYESNAIVEYLDEAYPAAGAQLFPGDAKTRALTRRLILEVDNYFEKPVDVIITQAFYAKPEERDAQKPPTRARR